MVTKPMKNAQHHESSQKCKSKPQDTTAYLSEWLSSKSPQVAGTGGRREKSPRAASVGMQTGAAAAENNTQGLQKIKNRATV